MKKLLTITGPSLAGKSHLAGVLNNTERYVELLSVTDRPIRSGEVSGKNYYFKSKQEFDQLMAKDNLVEQVNFNGFRYGITREEVNRVFSLGKQPFVLVEPEGRQQIKNYCKKQGWIHVPIFISNPPNIIAERFIDRYKNDTNKTDQVYINRLTSIMSTERGWIDEAISKDTPYKAVIKEYNSDNILMVVDIIDDLCHNTSPTFKNQKQKIL